MLSRRAVKAANCLLEVLSILVAFGKFFLSVLFLLWILFHFLKIHLQLHGCYSIVRIPKQLEHSYRGLQSQQLAVGGLWSNFLKWPGLKRILHLTAFFPSFFGKSFVFVVELILCSLELYMLTKRAVLRTALRGHLHCLYSPKVTA